MTELHQTLHDDAGICLWTLLAACALAVLLAIFLVHIVSQGTRRAYNNKKINDYNKQMGAMYEANNIDMPVENENPVKPEEIEAGSTRLFDGKK